MEEVDGEPVVLLIVRWWCVGVEGVEEYVEGANEVEEESEEADGDDESGTAMNDSESEAGETMLWSSSGGYSCRPLLRVLDRLCFFFFLRGVDECEPSSSRSGSGEDMLASVQLWADERRSERKLDGCAERRS